MMDLEHVGKQCELETCTQHGKSGVVCKSRANWHADCLLERKKKRRKENLGMCLEMRLQISCPFNANIARNTFARITTRWMDINVLPFLNSTFPSRRKTKSIRESFRGL